MNTIFAALTALVLASQVAVAEPLPAEESVWVEGKGKEACQFFGTAEWQEEDPILAVQFKKKNLVTDVKEGNTRQRLKCDFKITLDIAPGMMITLDKASLHFLSFQAEGGQGTLSYRLRVDGQSSKATTIKIPDGFEKTGLALENENDRLIRLGNCEGLKADTLSLSTSQTVRSSDSLENDPNALDTAISLDVFLAKFKVSTCAATVD